MAHILPKSEINIVMENLNISGICLCCLNNDRKMFNNEKAVECYKLLGRIYIPDEMSIQLCCECVVLLQKVIDLQNQVQHSYKVLSDFASKGSDLSIIQSMAVHRLERTQVFLFECVEEQQPSEINIVENEAFTETDIEIKVEIEENPISTEIITEVPLDVNTTPEFSIKTEPNAQTSQLYSDVEDLVSDNEDIISENEGAVSQTKTIRESFAFQKTVLPRKESPKLGCNSQMRGCSDLDPYHIEVVPSSKEKIVKIRKRDVKNPILKKLTYRCGRCFRISSNEKGLKIHMDLRHNEANPFSCEICNVRLAKSVHLRNHMKNHSYYLRCKSCNYKSTFRELMKLHIKQHENKIFNCKICKTEVIGSETEISEHKNTCTEVVEYKCDICLSRFKDKQELISHMPQHASAALHKDVIKIYECLKCHKRFDRKAFLNRHKKVHAVTTKNYICDHCGKSLKYKANLKRHLLIHEDKDSSVWFECKECDFKTDNRISLQKHFMHGKRHVEGHKYQCEHCKKLWSSKRGLRFHIDKIHMFGARTCDLCNKPFESQKILIEHQRVEHSINKVNECDVCGKNFKTQSILNRHKISHLTEKNFSCDICTKTFKSIFEVRQHKRRHDKSNWKMKECEECGKKFKEMSSYIRHVKATHKATEKPFSCELCETKFGQKSDVQKHIKYVHLKEPRPKKIKKKETVNIEEDMHQIQNQKEPCPKKNEIQTKKDTDGDVINSIDNTSQSNEARLPEFEIVKVECNF